MSSLGLADLLAADAAAFHAAAAAWQRMAQRIDDAAEELIRGTRDLEDTWPEGPASQAAHTRTANLRAEVSNAYAPARRISEALDHHGYAMASLRQQAEQIIASADRSGMTVDRATGTVTAPPEAYQNGAAQSTVQAVNAVVRELEDVLARARALDDSTTNAINVNLPDPETGFGRSSLPPISRQVLEAQAGREPRDIKAWWDTLTPQQQEQAIRDHPDLVGWLDGIPATDRDQANRIMLDRQQGDLAAREAALRDRLAQLQEQQRWHGGRAGHNPETAGLLRELDQVTAQRAGLAEVEQELGKLGDKGLLLGVDPAGDGKAIIAVGNPDTARHTAVWVPGLGTELEDTSSNVRRVADLQAAAAARGAGEVSAIMWLGYDAPELGGSVLGHERSEQGGAALDYFVDGLRASHDPGPSHVTAIGHSYGSTVVAEAALVGDGLAADDIVTAGSPGMHTDRAEDLQIDPRHVWAGRADGDAVAGGVGSIPFVHDNEPSDKDFGGNRYVVDTEGHSAYWERGSQSLTNQARIVVGDYEGVGLEHGAVPQP